MLKLFIAVVVVVVVVFERRLRRRYGEHRFFFLPQFKSCCFSCSILVAILLLPRPLGYPAFQWTGVIGYG